MGLNLDFMLDPDVEEAHPQNDLRSIVWNIELLDELARNGGVRPLGEMGIYDDPDDVVDDDEAGDDEGYEAIPVKEGIRTIEFLLTALRATPAESIDEGPELLIEELEEVVGCFRLAAKDATFRFMQV